MESFSLDASLGGFVLFEDVECDALEDGEVLRGVAGSFAAKVFVEIHVQHPVQFVFDAQCWRTTEFSRRASSLRPVM